VHAEYFSDGRSNEWNLEETLPDVLRKKDHQIAHLLIVQARIEVSDLLVVEVHRVLVRRDKLAMALILVVRVLLQSIAINLDFVHGFLNQIFLKKLQAKS
jgi:hypothetical protein